MAYAEAVELGFLPQMFGGTPVDAEKMSTWKKLRSWVHIPASLTASPTA